jgi:hypothetical protein
MGRPFHLVDDGWLDIGSFGRQGPGRRDALSPAQIDFITRTVRGTPEVMVKMLNRGGQNVRSVGQHLRYLSRDGSVAIDTDTGHRLQGPEGGKTLIDDWDLDLDEGRQTTDLRPRVIKNPPSLDYA